MPLDRRAALKAIAATTLGGSAWQTVRGAEPAKGELSIPRELRADVCIIGGGSGGIGAALAASRAGADVILIERQPKLGGTSTRAYVCHWGSGPGDRFAHEIYQRLRKLPHAVGITSDHNADRRKGSFGLWLITPGLKYEQTLRRAGLTRPDWYGVAFDPDALSAVAAKLLAETGRCRVLTETTFVAVQAEGDRLISIRANSGSGEVFTVRASVFVDSTGGAHLCRAAGCEMMLGPEPRERFDEPFAPETPEKTLNAISLCYRVRPSDNPVRQAAPDPPVGNWPRSAHVSSVPGGGLILNPLATLPGRALIDLGYDECMARCKRLVQAQWRWWQAMPTFAPHEFHSFAPMLGIRESYRVVGRYVLTQHDLTAGLAGQKHSDLIATAEHPMDVHGSGGRRVHGALKGPYGIPYRCLIPEGHANLLVACRGASFSHIAASSCRLSRTILALGHAAGLAAAEAVKSNVSVSDVDVVGMQEGLGIELR